jgi:hypothetical protein
MRRRGQEGSVLALVALSLVVLLGMAALAIDLGNLRAHRRQMQSAADAAALAAASNLPPLGSGASVCGPGSLSDAFARDNTKLTATTNLIDNDNVDTSDCQIIGQSVRVWPREADVPYVFGRVLGFINTDVSARARARIVYLTTARGLMPLGIEDLKPKTVSVVVDQTQQSIPLTNKGAVQGCYANTTEGYPFWCGAGVISSALPAGGSTISLRVVDTSNQVVTWDQIGYVGTDQTLATCGCTIKDVRVNPVADPFIYVTDTANPKSFGVTAHLTNVPANANVSIIIDGTKKAATLSGTLADGQWSTANAAFTSSGTAGGSRIDVEIKVGNGNKAPTYTTVGGTAAGRVYAHDLGDLLQQGAQSSHYVVPGGTTAQRSVEFNLAFRVLTRGREVVLKLGGGAAGGNSGNFGSLDLDTNASWPVYRCYPGGTPNLADEVEHGSCTPYSLGQSVATQTGNSAGQVEHGLDARIGKSPAVKPFDVTDPPPSGDPRWINLILVPPIVFANCTGSCTTTVTGFGNFYITEYSGDSGSKLKNGEVRGVFWDRVNPAGPYSTTCTDPSGICLASIALMPWDG